MRRSLVEKNQVLNPSVQSHLIFLVHICIPSGSSSSDCRPTPKEQLATYQHLQLKVKLTYNLERRTGEHSRHFGDHIAGFRRRGAIIEALVDRIGWLDCRSRTSSDGGGENTCNSCEMPCTICGGCAIATTCMISMVIDTVPRIGIGVVSSPGNQASTCQGGNYRTMLRIPRRQLLGRLNKMQFLNVLW